MSALLEQSRLFAGRNLRRMRRNPSTIVGAVVTPLVFLLGFYLVLGRTLAASNVDYAQFLPPAIVVQSTLNVAIGSAFWLADDVANGMLTRARSLPIARVAPLVGRILADLTRATVSTVVVLVAGAALGYRFSGGPLSLLLLWALVLAWSAAAAAGFGLLTLRSRNPEAAANLLTIPFLPLVFLSTAYVPAERFPSALEGVVAHQPVSVVIGALRELSSGGAEAGSAVGAVGAVGAVAPALLWSVALLAVFLAAAHRVVRVRR